MCVHFQHHWQTPTEIDLERLLPLALSEDTADWGDLTSLALVAETAQ